MRKVFLLSCIFILIITFVRCSEEKSEKVLATIEDKEITIRDFTQYYENSLNKLKPEQFPPMENTDDVKDFLKIILTKEAMVLYAEELNLFDNADFQKRYEEEKSGLLVKNLSEKITEDVRVTDEEVLNYYQQMDKAYHIYIIQCANKDNIELAKDELEEGKDFSDVASKYDITGRWEDTKIPPPFEIRYTIIDELQDIFNLQVGETSDIIHLPLQNIYLIAKMKDIKTVELKPFEEMEDIARGYLLNMKKQNEINKYKLNLYNSYEPIFNEEALEIIENGGPDDFRNAIEDDILIADCDVVELRFSDIFQKDKIDEEYFIKINRDRENFNLSKLNLIRSKIIEKLLAWSANKRGLEGSETIKEKLQTFKEKWAVDKLYNENFYPNIPEPTPEEIKNYYEENKEEFLVEENAEIRLIRTSTEEEALEAKKFIEEGGNSLEALYEFSLNKDFDGVRNIKRDSTNLPELKDIVLEMEKGEVTNPIKITNSDEYYVAYILNTEEEHYLPLDEVKERIIRKLWSREEKQKELDRLSQQWMDEILSKYNHEIKEDYLEEALKKATNVREKKKREYEQQPKEEKPLFH